MIKEETRRSQSATFFNTVNKQGESSKQTSTKRLRIEEENPSIQLDHELTNILIQQSSVIDMNVLVTPVDRSINKEKLAMKLNHLKNKSARYESHKSFLNQCIREKLIPKGLKVYMEPTIGNHDQEFLDNWNQLFKDFSLVLMKNIVSFCDQTLTATTTEVKTTEQTLKHNMEKQEFADVEQVITQNEETTKRILKQRKFKKFNYLKHKPNHKTQVQHNQNQTERPFSSYANAVTGNNNQPRPNNSNLNVSKSTFKENQQRNNYKQHPLGTTHHQRKNSNTDVSELTLSEKLQSVNTRNQNYKRGNSRNPSRNPSATNQNYKNQVNELKEEIKILRQNQNYQKRTGNITNVNQHESNENANPKNGETPSQIGGQSQNIEIISVVSFIEETMKTLSTYKERLKKHLNIDLIQ